MNTETRLSPKQAQLLEAIRAGATLRYAGWQEIRVIYGAADSRNYTARQQTLFALRDRGLVEVDKNGVRVAEASA